jgi:hypothetical protein
MRQQQTQIPENSKTNTDTGQILIRQPCHCFFDMLCVSSKLLCFTQRRKSPRAMTSYNTVHAQINTQGERQVSGVSWAAYAYLANLNRIATVSRNVNENGNGISWFYPTHHLIYACTCIALSMSANSLPPVSEKWLTFPLSVFAAFFSARGNISVS